MNTNQILNKVTSLCSRKEMCASDVQQYLSKYKECGEIEKNKIINFLTENKFIDEKRYAFAFVNDSYKYNKWGKWKIKQILKQKNISEEIVAEAIDNIDEQEYNNIKEQLAERKRNLLSIEDPLREQKVYLFLKSKGF